MTTRRAREEEGFTLIELLLAIVILSISMVVIVGGMSTLVIGSDVHRKQTRVDTVLKDWAEAVKARGWQSSNGCSATGPYSLNPLRTNGFLPPAAQFPPAGIGTSAIVVRSWNGTSGTPFSGCNSSHVFHRVTITAFSCGTPCTADGRYRKSLDVVVSRREQP